MVDVDKPRHHWGTIFGAIGALMTVLGGAAALGRFVFSAPTREDYQRHEDRIQGIEKDHAVLKDHVGGIESKLDGITVNISKITERKR